MELRAYSSVAEQGAHNLLVVGSNPTGPTNYSMIQSYGDSHRIIFYLKWDLLGQRRSSNFLKGSKFIKTDYAHPALHFGQEKEFFS